MALPLVPVAVALGALFLFGSKKKDDGSPGVRGVTRTTAKAPKNFMKTDYTASLLRRQNLPPAEEELPEAIEPWKSAAMLTPWSPKWLLFWNQTMQVIPDVPQSVLDQFYRGLTNPTVFYSLGPEQYLRQFAAGLVLGPKGVGAGDRNVPRHWAAAWLAACEVAGPSPSNGGTKNTWAPYFGLSVDGAKRAEECQFRPRTWPWTVNKGRPSPQAQVLNGEIAQEYKGGKAGFGIAEDVVALIPYVGGILSEALTTAQNVSGYGKDYPDLNATNDPNRWLNYYGVALIDAAGGWRPTPKDHTIEHIGDNVHEHTADAKTWLDENGVA